MVLIGWIPGVVLAIALAGCAVNASIGSSQATARPIDSRPPSTVASLPIETPLTPTPPASPTATAMPPTSTPPPASPTPDFTGETKGPLTTATYRTPESDADLEAMLDDTLPAEAHSQPFTWQGFVLTKQFTLASAHDIPIFGRKMAHDFVVTGCSFAGIINTRSLTGFALVINRPDGSTGLGVFVGALYCRSAVDLDQFSHPELFWLDPNLTPDRLFSMLRHDVPFYATAVAKPQPDTNGHPELYGLALTGPWSY